MNYEIIWDPKCEKQLEKLSRDISARIIKRVKLCAITGRNIEALKEH